MPDVELTSVEVPSSDNFHRVIIETEQVAHLSALNKIREGLLFAMSRDLASGGDGKRYIDALKAINEEFTSSQASVQALLNASE